MEAPLHKLCGERHWSNQPCPATPTKSSGGSSTVERRSSKSDAGGSTPPPRSKSPIKKQPGPTIPVKRIAGERGRGSKSPKKAHIIATPATSKPKPKKPAKKAAKRGRGRPPTGFDKVKYQRDYMRKRRARISYAGADAKGEPK